MEEKEIPEKNGVLYGVPVIERTEDWNLLCNIEAVLKYYHPDLSITQEELAEHLEKEGGKPNNPEMDRVSWMLHEFVGIDHECKPDPYLNREPTDYPQVTDILSYLAQGIPPIVTIIRRGIKEKKEGYPPEDLHTILIVGYYEDLFYYINLAPLTEEIELFAEEDVGIQIMFLDEFLDKWMVDVLAIKNDVGSTYRFKEGLLIEHLREEHHGYRKLSEARSYPI